MRSKVCQSLLAPSLIVPLDLDVLVRWADGSSHKTLSSRIVLCFYIILIVYVSYMDCDLQQYTIVFVMIYIYCS